MALPKTRVRQGMPDWLDDATAELVRESTSALAAAMHDAVFGELERSLQLKVDQGEITGGIDGKDGKDSVVPGPPGKAGTPGKDSTVPGPEGPEGPRGPEGPAGKNSTVPGPPGKDSTVPGPAGKAADIDAFIRAYEPESIRSYGALGDGKDITAEVVKAQKENVAVYYPPAKGDYVPGAWDNMLGNYTNASGPRWQAGRRFEPTPDPRPVIWAQKHSSATRSTETTEWDSGAGYFGLIKEGGSAPGIALNSFSRHISDEPSGIGGAIGFHARARGERPLSNSLGIWVYSESRNYNSTTQQFEPIQEHNGFELNLNNKAPDQGWRTGGGSGSSRGMILVTQDNSNPVTHMLYIGNGTNAPLGKIHTGILLKGDGFVPSGANTATGVNNNEALRIEGASSQANQYTGIRFRSGLLATGVSFTETAFSNNAAILLADGHRIVVGPGPASSKYLAFESTQASFNNMDVAVRGAKVLGSRKTGWQPPVGNARRTVFNTSTVTVPELAEALKALLDDLTTHGLIGA